MAYGTINADVMQTSTSGGILGAGNASIMKNRIINGDMRIDQRNAGASLAVTTSWAYCVDRFASRGMTGSGHTVQQTTTAPAGFRNSLKFTVGTGGTVAAGDINGIQQIIEGFNTADLMYGTADAKTVTLSFWVYSSLTGTFGGSFKNDNANRSYPFTYTISSANTWTQINVTVAGDTTGTWSTTTSGGLYVTFGLGVGSTYAGTAGSWAAANYLGATGCVNVVATSGATFYITGVQLEVGSNATGYEYRVYGTELANCQRYYWKPDTSAGVFIGTVYNTVLNRGVISFPFHVTMRAVPTGTYTISGSAVFNTAYLGADMAQYYMNITDYAAFSAFTVSAEL